MSIPFPSPHDCGNSRELKVKTKKYSVSKKVLSVTVPLRTFCLKVTPSCPIDRMEFSKIVVREAGGDTDTGVELVKKKKKEVVDIPDEVGIVRDIYPWVLKSVLPDIRCLDYPIPVFSVRFIIDYSCRISAR